MAQVLAAIQICRTGGLTCIVDRRLNIETSRPFMHFARLLRPNVFRESIAKRLSICSKRLLFAENELKAVTIGSARFCSWLKRLSTCSKPLSISVIAPYEIVEILLSLVILEVFF